MKQFLPFTAAKFKLKKSLIPYAENKSESFLTLRKGNYIFDLNKKKI